MLVILETEIGKKFVESKELKKFLGARSTSILVHGLTPMSVSDADRYFSAARELFLIEIPDFDEHSRALQFPWLDSRGKFAFPEHLSEHFSPAPRKSIKADKS